MSQAFRVRASSIASFFDCPARWAATHLEGMRLPARAPTIIGTAVHASTAVFDASRLSENKATWLSADDAAEVLESTLKNPDQEVIWDGVTMDKAMRVGLGVHTRYCNEIAPGQIYVAVEETLNELVIDVPCNPSDPEETLEITLTGTLDRIREEAVQGATTTNRLPIYGYGIADVKTGARACSTATGKHKAQIGVYELLAEASGDRPITLPGQLIQLQTSSNYAAALEPVHGSRLALLGVDSRVGLLEHMARMLKTGDFYGNASSFLCTEKYCANYQNCLFR